MLLYLFSGTLIGKCTNILCIYSDRFQNMGNPVHRNRHLFHDRLAVVFIPYCCPKHFFLNDISHLLRRIVSVLLRVSGEHRGQGTHSAAMERKIFIFLPRFLMLSEDSEVPDAFISVYRHCDLTHIGVWRQAGFRRRHRFGLCRRRRRQRQRQNEGQRPNYFVSCVSSYFK